MKTMNFYVRGDDVLFRCETCGLELHVDPNTPFMPQLLHISHTHECWRNAHGTTVRSRADLRVVHDDRPCDGAGGEPVRHE